MERKRWEGKCVVKGEIIDMIEVVTDEWKHGKVCDGWC